MSTSSSITFRSDCDSDYAVDTRGSFEKISKQNRRPSYRRSGTAPSSVNGIHRRRQNRWTWGHGRGARLENLRAIARCVIAAVAALFAASATANPITTVNGIGFVTVGDPGNVGKIVGSGTFGSVAQEFAISKTEVTNAQYVAFLNAVAHDDTLGLYNTQMGSNAAGGITRTGSQGTFVYQPTNGTAANQPVNFLSVYSAARFANWLHNGAPANVPTASVNSVVNTGAYTLANISNPGSALIRNPGAQFYLPNRDEWFKAAFYSPALNNGSGGYNLYATNTSSQPSISTDPTAVGTNLGYYGQTNSAIPMNAGGLANSMSYYEVIGMLGNVSEWLENSNATQATWIGGWYNMPAGSLNTWANSNFAGSLQSSMNMTGAQGFRLAAVPVPEPSTIVMAGLGLIAVAGGRFMSRRRAAHRVGA